jgi:hypothetical protein
MSDAQFPTRTAGDLKLPNGDTVWVCQLNSMLFEEVGTKTAWHAQKEVRRYLKGGSEYPAVLDYLRSLTVDEQATLIARQEYYTIDADVNGRFPAPQRPEQGDMTPDGFANAVVAWEDACRKADEKREKARQKRWDDEIKRNTVLTAGVRMERCCAAYVAVKWGEAYVKRREIETMHRAVRFADDHARRYFPSPEAYEDADDAVQAALREFFYVTIAEPKSEDVPTSPAGS